MGEYMPDENMSIESILNMLKEYNTSLEIMNSSIEKSKAEYNRMYFTKKEYIYTIRKDIKHIDTEGIVSICPLSYDSSRVIVTYSDGTKLYLPEDICDKVEIPNITKYMIAKTIDEKKKLYDNMVQSCESLINKIIGKKVSIKYNTCHPTKIKNRPYIIGTIVNVDLSKSIGRIKVTIKWNETTKYTRTYDGCKEPFEYTITKENKFTTTIDNVIDIKN